MALGPTSAYREHYFFYFILLYFILLFYFFQMAVAVRACREFEILPLAAINVGVVLYTPLLRAAIHTGYITQPSKRSRGGYLTKETNIHGIPWTLSHDRKDTKERRSSSVNSSKPKQPPIQ
jgi:hypothetical protein